MSRAVYVLLLAAITLGLGAVDSAWARGGWGCMNANLPPEQSAQLFDLKQQFINETAGLRKQMMVKTDRVGGLVAESYPRPKSDSSQAAGNQRLERSTPDEAYGFLGPAQATASARRHGHGLWPRQRHGHGAEPRL